MKSRALLLAAGILLAACTAAPSPPAPTASLAPTTSAPPTTSPRPPAVSTRLTATLTGRLARDGACLRIGAYLLAWPPDFAMSLAGETLTVTDRLNGQQAAVRLGDTVQLAGGEVPLDEALRQTVPAGCPGPYWVVGSLPETVAPAAPLTATPAVAAFTPTLPITPSPSATPTATPPPGVTEIAGDGIITFTSSVLGLTFSYKPSQPGVNVRTFATGDRVYVYGTDLAPTAGQYVQVFHKAPADSLTQAIQKQILPGFNPQDCPITIRSRPDDQVVPPSSYVFAWIMPRLLPTTSPSDDVFATQMAQAQKCPQPYTVAGGEVYFMEDTRHPERFFFFKIGQYWIYGAGPGEFGYPWQDTLRVLELPPG